MAVPSQAHSDPNALSPPLTPNPDPQSRDETSATRTNEHGNGRKRSQTTAVPSPKRQMVEVDVQDSNLSQQQMNDVRRESSDGVGLGIRQQQREDDTLPSVVVEAQPEVQPDTVQNNTAEVMHQARLLTHQSHSPVVNQSPSFRNAPMPPPPPIPAAELAHRRTSASPTMRPGVWRASPSQSVSQSPNIGHRQVLSGSVPAPQNVLQSHSPTAVGVMQGLQQFLFVDIFSLHSPYDSQGCQDILGNYISSRGGLGNLGPTERLRLQVLQNAVAEGDWLFLFLHHIISQQFLNPGFVPPDIAMTPNFSAAAHILNTILGSPQLHDSAMMTFFAAFPCQLGLTLSFHATKEEGLLYLQQFMPNLPGIWKSMESECRDRQYPPTVVELVGYMKILSPALMRIFFTAARRTAWPCSPEQESGAQMIQLFDQVDKTFARAKNMFFSQFQHYQQSDEIQEYLRLQRIFRHLSQGQLTQDQVIQAQQRQDQAFRMQHGVHQQMRLQQAQVAQAQLQIQLQQAQQRQIGQLQPQRVNVVRPIQFSSANAIRSSLQVASGRPSSRQPSQHHSLLSTTTPSSRHPALSDFGVPTAPGNQGSSVGQSLPPPRVNGQPISGIMGASGSRDHQALPTAGLFMPALTDPPPPQPAQPNPQMAALHQAYLREPILLQPLRPSAEGPAPSFYQMVSYCILPPKRLVSGSRVQEWTFDLHEGEYEHIALTTPSEVEGQRSTRVLAEDSRQYRLRCSKMPRSAQPIRATDWIISDTSFPTNMYMVINGHDLQVRRKLHYGKDLPVDVTDHLRSGQNKLECLVNQSIYDPDASNYVFAIETVGVKSEETIIRECRKRERAAEEVLSAIKNSLKGAGPALENDDDDIIMVSGNVTIDLVDPITQNTTLTIPVRGLDCTHWSCFDLPAFLQSRMFPDPGISAVDVWRCPICRGDARPQSLIVDGFVLKVREKLDQDGQQKVRAIIVEADGSWKPKPEKMKEGGLSSQSRPTTLSTPSHQGTPVLQPSVIANPPTPQPDTTNTSNPAPKKPVEVVDIGSDTD
ncbi:Eukaryotic translation initiation factor 3 subunit A [Venturia nashicola]|uniref:Eukaryotic translation initiation factor 3 subunit A n=1 Tax=Venturia nashicola TaxID=86259 RepID=A0A4Z1PUV7_9PEZI|nr:Eukaryotic translation initiation factor 3 subunit A [Venturia nashicola]